MPEAISRNHESTNWLTIYPAKDEQEHQQLASFAESLGDLPDTQQIVLALDEAVQTGKWNGRKLAPGELSLLKNVYDYISHGVEIGMDEAVSLKLRQVTDTELKKILKDANDVEKSVETWSYYSGDYRGLLVGDSLDAIQSAPFKTPATGDVDAMWDSEYVPHEHVGDTVHFLSERIKQLLATEKNDPIVVVDIGAMYGTTLLELALEYKDEILAGRLVLIATNISLNTDIIKNTRKPTNGNRLYGNYDQLFLEVGELVHFVVSDMAGLMHRKIQLPNGREITLDEDTVDIAHENWSISKHSKSLEADIITLADLVGDDGLIMSHRYDPWRGSGGLTATSQEQGSPSSASFFVSFYSRARPSTENREKLQDVEMRNLGIDSLVRANRTLAKRDMHLVEQVTNSQTNETHRLNYSFWMGKNAPPLSLFTEDGAKTIITADGKENVDRRKPRPWSILKGLLGLAGK